MADEINTTEPTIELVIEKPNRFQSFTLNHPRVMQAIGFTAIAAATYGVATVVKRRMSDDNSNTPELVHGEIVSSPETTQVAEA